MKPTKFLLALLLSGYAAQALAETARYAPYISEEVTERIQNLADGNQLTNRSSQRVYRDSAGRTRRERYDAKGALESVALSDADGAGYTLLPARKTAIRSQASSARVRARLDETLASAQQKAGGATPQLVLNGVPRADGSAAPLKVLGADSAAGSQLSRLAADAIADGKYLANRTTRTLGLRFFEGVQAEGSLMSYEIPEGAQGNRLAMTISTEVWTARELGITMYSKRSDPRSGDYITRVTSLRREEPPAALFMPPPDYTVVEQGGLTVAPVESAKSSHRP